MPRLRFNADRTTIKNAAQIKQVNVRCQDAMIDITYEVGAYDVGTDTFVASETRYMTLAFADCIAGLQTTLNNIHTRTVNQLQTSLALPAGTEE